MTVHIIVGLSKATKDGENNERTPGIFEETLIKREIIWTAHCCDGIISELGLGEERYVNKNTCSLVIFYSMSMTSVFVWKLRVDNYV